MMNPAIFILIVGFSYIVVFGGLSYLRREGLSFQFALEAVILTLLGAALTQFTSINFSPALFLLFLYIITMRTRLLVEVATMLAQRGNYPSAQRVFSFAEKINPDQSSKILIVVNQSVMLIKQGLLDEAIRQLEELLKEKNKSYLGVKNESAVHYNLGIAYLKKSQDALGVAELNRAIETLPASIYAQRAAQALEKRRNHNSPK